MLSQRTADDVFDAGEAADVVLRGRADVDARRLHDPRCQPNRSPRRRAGVAIRYMPGTSVFERNLNPAGGRSGIPVHFAKRPLWLLRGQDRTGRNDFAVGHRG